MSLIVWSNTKRTVGEVSTPLYCTNTQNERIPPQPILILREATHEQWEASVRENGGEPDGYGPYAYYYEIHTD